MTGANHLHLLVDLENVQPTAGELAALLGESGHAWIFHGANQKKLLPALQELGDGITLVPISKPGANSLDFHLVFYLGYLTARQANSHFIVVSKDKGYDPAIAHAKALDFDVKRVTGLSTNGSRKRAAVAEAVRSAAPQKKPQALTSATAVQKPLTSKKSPSARKAVAAKKVPTARASPAVKKVPVKNATPPKQSATKRSATSSGQKATLKDAAMPSSKAAMKSVAAVYETVLTDLLGRNRPRSMKALEHHIQTKFGPTPVPGKVSAVVSQLQAAGTIQMVGGKLVYFGNGHAAAGASS